MNDHAPLTQAKEILKQVFGYSEFISLQEKVIENILRKRDTLAVMPTGSGKSLCYQIPALIFPGLTIVISPLIALMKDQVSQISASGAHAVMLNSTLDASAYRSNVEHVKSGRAKLLYLAPETLLKPGILALLSGCPIDCFTIDEAHCISEWGHDFRPEYRQLLPVRGRFPKAVCLALTATATLRVREDIRSALGFKASDTFLDSFNRKNLFLQVLPKEEPGMQTVRFIRGFASEPGIVYCASRRQVDALCDRLRKEGISALPYHAGLSAEERNRNQELFIRDSVQIIVATIAFGMGINKPNVRFVLHYDLPRNIESYYQEIGRAGRDGLRSDCLLLYSRGDIYKVRHFIDQKEEKERRIAGQQLQALLRLVECRGCRRVRLLEYFGENFPAHGCGMCDNCLPKTEKGQVDITIPARKFLSCVKRTGERFGPAHIVSVLRGSREKKVLALGHDRLSTYGIGKEFSRDIWSDLARQFLEQELLDQDPRHGGMKITASGWRVMRGEEQISGFLESPPPPAPAAGPAAETRKFPDESPGFDQDLFTLLRKKRKEIAEAENVPPYVVFSDRTLREIAASFPKSPESLLEIHGVGTAKLKKYGDRFLEIVRKYSPRPPIGERSNGECSFGDLLPDFRSLVCLANSRKFSGRCVAGKEWKGDRIGSWIRPVGGSESGELAREEICYKNGLLPKLLDIIRVELRGHSFHSFQQENFTIAGTCWVKTGEFLLAEMETLCDDVDTLWENGYHSHSGLNDRVPFETAKNSKAHSLLLIRPENPRIRVEEDAHGLKRLRAAFEFRGTPYRLGITDPLIEKAYLYRDIGEYPSGGRKIYVTVSLGEEFEGYCYKLVAGWIA